MKKIMLVLLAVILLAMQSSAQDETINNATCVIGAGKPIQAEQVYSVTEYNAAVQEASHWRAAFDVATELLQRERRESSLFAGLVVTSILGEDKNAKGLIVAMCRALAANDRNAIKEIFRYLELQNLQK